MKKNSFIGLSLEPSISGRNPKNQRKKRFEQNKKNRTNNQKEKHFSHIKASFLGEISHEMLRMLHIILDKKN
jgi:hypothetical protein